MEKDIVTEEAIASFQRKMKAAWAEFGAKLKRQSSATPPASDVGLPNGHSAHDELEEEVVKEEKVVTRKTRRGRKGKRKRGFGIGHHHSRGRSSGLGVRNAVEEPEEEEDAAEGEGEEEPGLEDSSQDGGPAEDESSQDSTDGCPRKRIKCDLIVKVENEDLANKIIE